MSGILDYEERLTEEHLLALGPPNLVTLPVLGRVSLVPLKPWASGQRAFESHRLSILSSYTLYQARDN
jgi:hypothetical protein